MTDIVAKTGIRRDRIIAYADGQEARFPNYKKLLGLLASALTPASYDDCVTDYANKHGE